MIGFGSPDVRASGDRVWQLFLFTSPTRLAMPSSAAIYDATFGTFPSLIPVFHFPVYCASKIGSLVDSLLSSDERNKPSYPSS
jgi:hypothetical protein